MNNKKKIRKEFRDSVFKRDGNKCVFCNRTDNLDAHHITDRNELPNGGYVMENGITLCPEHHLKAEEYHLTNGVTFSSGFSPNDLYNKINSTKEDAIAASIKLKGKNMTKPNYTSITVILDESGSMSSCVSDTIGGFNTFLEKQKQLDGECDISLVKFNSVSEIIYNSKPVKTADELNKTNYVPKGMTALLDAVGTAIDIKGKELESISEDQRPSKVIFVIITDGDENSSKTYSRETIKEMIKLQTDVYSWEFIFLGANIDAHETASSLSIVASRSLNYSTKSGGMKKAFASVNSYATRSRSGGSNTSFTVDDIANNQP